MPRVSATLATWDTVRVVLHRHDGTQLVWYSTVTMGHSSCGTPPSRLSATPGDDGTQFLRGVECHKQVGEPSKIGVRSPEAPKPPKDEVSIRDTRFQIASEISDSTPAPTFEGSLRVMVGRSATPTAPRGERNRRYSSQSQRYRPRIYPSALKSLNRQGTGH